MEVQFPQQGPVSNYVLIVRWIVGRDGGNLIHPFMSITN